MVPYFDMIQVFGNVYLWRYGQKQSLNTIYITSSTSDQQNSTQNLLHIILIVARSAYAERATLCSAGQMLYIIQSNLCLVRNSMVKPGGRNQSSLRPRDCACCFHIFHQRAFAQAQQWCPLVLMKWPTIICLTSWLLLLLGTFVLCGKRTPVFRVVYLCTCIPVFQFSWHCSSFSRS